MSRTYDLLDQPEILSVLFHPRRDTPADGSGLHVAIPVEAQCHVGGKIYPAGPYAPVLLYFHGNGEIASDYDDIAPLYERLGLSLFVVDFRGYGRSDGTPTATTLVSDAVAVFEQAEGLLKQAGLKGENLFVMGRSMGSVSAIHLAAHAGERIRGLIIESGFSDTFGLIERIGGVTMESANEASEGFNNGGKIETVKVPTLILHGQEDWIIPIDDGRELYRRSGAEAKRIVEIPGAGHNDIISVGLRAYFQAIGELVAG
ncbi:alpha/beta hydrolase [Magnetospira thiophila]